MSELYPQITDAMGPEYREVPTAQLQQRIGAHKAALGEKLVVLGHHYQREEVIRFADFRGDSLKLAQLAAEQAKAEYIVFCGVHFMAESADILSADHQKVVLPNLRAGCAMADMAEDADVAAALDEVTALTGERKVVPITYVNSTAAIKAVTADHGGACCTSSNVRNVFEWAFRDEKEGGAGGDIVFAIPDQHLGRNTAFAMGYDDSNCVVYDPALPAGGLKADDLAGARFILWKGHCYVHQVFDAQAVQNFRASHPDWKIIVHPECPREVVAQADASGSTSQIIQALAEAAPGSRWAVGTEANLVQRLNRQRSDVEVAVLAQAPARCAHMAQVDLPHLLWVLDRIAADNPANVVAVPKDIARSAKVALDRMLSIRAVNGLTTNATRDDG